MKKRKIQFKCFDFSPLGSFGAGIAGAIGSVAAANIAKNASNYAAEQSLIGARETNAAQMQIANELNETNIRNVNATNETNLQIQRETNEANLALAREQNQWNLEQWQRENEYNSPVHQVELYRQAGLNPATLAGSGWSTAANVQSADLANQQAAVMQAPQGTAMPNLQNPFADSSKIIAAGAAEQAKYINQAVQNATSAAKSFSEAQQLSASAKYAHQMNKEQLQNLIQDTIGKKLENYSLTPLRANELQANINLINQNSDYIGAKTGLAKEQTTWQKIQNKIGELDQQYREFCQDYLKGIKVQDFKLACINTERAFENWKQEHQKTAFMSANGGLSPSDYASLYGAIYSANAHLEGVKYSADRSYSSSIYASDMNYAGTMQTNMNNWQISLKKNATDLKIAEMNNTRGWFSTIATGVVGTGMFMLGKGKLGPALDILRNIERHRKSWVTDYMRNNMPSQPFH